MLIAWFRDLTKESVELAGGKGANLGEMYNARLPVPPGFVVTSEAYKLFLSENKLWLKINEILKSTDVNNNEQLQDCSKKIQKLILEGNIPETIKNKIIEAYDNLNVNLELNSISKDALNIIKAGRDTPYVAVRSSATAEDLPQASFAGLQATFVNVKGEHDVVRAVQMCWASLFTARAIYYREKNNFPHEKVFIAVVVQRMIDSEKAGVMFTINPITNNNKEIVIEAAFGLGDAVVAGEVIADTYILDKEPLAIKEKKVNKQEWCYKRDSYSGQTIKKDISEEKGRLQKLNDHEINKLGYYGKVIEKHYGMPMDIEFGVEGAKIYILQARAVTTTKKEFKEEKVVGEVILQGLGASPGVKSGKVKIVSSLEDLGKILPGDILVTKMTSPDMVPAMERAEAIVTDEGSLTSHASIVSRELGIPCVVGTEKATSVLSDDQEITVDGMHGKIYKGIIRVEEEKEDYERYKDIKTKTKIYMNLGEPDKIDEYKNLPFDGIGLMRIEFLITSKIGKHPLYLIEQGNSEEYISKLKEGILKVAKTIFPKPVVVRFSDFKTNEYRELEGGEKYEPHEENPMMGFRGVSRYISREFREAFKLECKAIKRARKECNNIHVMLPFVRNEDEVKKCLKIIEEEELERGENFKIWIMAEVPSVCLLAERFCKLDIDGVSIGSNDLTQFVLGVDRDSTKLAKMGYFDERNEAVLEAIKKIIHGFKGKTVSICGQAPSVYPHFTEFLVKEGITSISVNPDVVLKTRSIVAKVEEKLK